MRKRIEENQWPCVALGKVHTPAMIREIKAWLRENAGGQYRVRTIQETVVRTTTKRRTLKTIATLVRFEQEEDCFLFKLTWSDYE